TRTCATAGTSSAPRRPRPGRPHVALHRTDLPAGRRRELLMTATMTDLFAGIGGSSTGASQVPGVEVVEAANHWGWAIAVHNENHPETEHYEVDLHQDDPRHFSTTDLLWASPECTKWSQAGGSQPKPAIE